MARTSMDDPAEQSELQRAFEAASQGTPMVPDSKASMEIVDGVITARRVEVARNLPKILADVKALAAAAGTDWFYRFPVWNARKGRQDFIEGPSIKLANAIVMLYGNCAVDCRIVEQSNTEWMIYAKFIDYERGVSLVRPWLADKGAAKIGGDDAGRKLNMALQVGVSKAERNVICNGLQILSDFAFEEAQKNLVDKIGRNVDAYRTRAVKWFADNGIDLKRVEAITGRASKEWMAPDLARIAAEVKAVEDGMASAAETWPTEAPPEPKRSDITDVPIAGQEVPPPSPGAGPAAGGSINNPHTASATAAAATAPPEREQAGESEPSPSTPMKKNWSVPPNIVGQEAVLKALGELLDMCGDEAEVDELLEQNAPRLAKITGNKRLEWSDRVRKHREMVK